MLMLCPGGTRGREDSSRGPASAGGIPAIKALREGLAGNRILDRKATSMVAREFKPGFRVDLHHKDMGIILAAAREAGVAIPLGAHTAQLMQSLRQLGHGDLDHSALLLQVEQLSGRTSTN